nr:immunoglobulin light chain junction region [Macaca mulatta]
CMQHKELPLTF